MAKKFYYDSAYDNKQEGIIHPSEPVQAVFFSRLGYEVKGPYFNKDYKMSDKEEKSSKISIIQTHLKRGKSFRSLNKDKLNIKSDSEVNEEICPGNLLTSKIFSWDKNGYVMLENRKN